MLTKTSIEWTESTWNPVTGCTKISAGCLNCYAERMALRLKAMGQKNYSNGFTVTLHPHMLSFPIKKQKPQMIFVNSMSDLFHDDVPVTYIKQIFKIMNNAKWHRFQVLTKRVERLVELSSLLEWTDNIWMGVTVESATYVDRIEYLRKIPAAIKFISMEPLLGPISKINLSNIDWVIVGGESGPGARKMDEKWALDIKDICIQENVPFFFKQWGGWGADGKKRSKKQNGRILKGRTWNATPLSPSL